MSIREAVREARRALRALPAIGPNVVQLQRDVDALRAQVGAIDSRWVRSLPPDRLSDAEFSVYSQFGEDGIIQFLLAHVPIEQEIFVEFGVEAYAESNTRFLLIHDNWRGLIIDGNDAHVEFTRKLGLDWQYDLNPIVAFIDRSNINDLILSGGLRGEIGLLSVDIDGNDYWILEAIDSISPRILILEYNSTFGPDAAVTIPYEPRFTRRAAHFSHLYWGASLTALTMLADRKGYALVGGNRAGNNAFFVRRDVLRDLPEISVTAAYAPSRFRESQGPDGERTYVADHGQRLAMLADLPIWDVDAQRTLTIRERYGLA